MSGASNSSARRRPAPAGLVAETGELGSLRSPPLKEQVTRELLRLIQDGVLAGGEQLPSERELSERLEVSRGTVREAVQFLQALGVVESRHGSGTFVRAAHTDRTALAGEWRAWTRRHSGRVRELLEVRRGLESLAAELAAERGGGDGVHAMEEALEQMAGAVDAHDVPVLVQADILFHHGLSLASANVALIELADALGTQLLRERAATWDSPGRPQRSLREHREILDAVRAREPARARAALLAHVISIERDVTTLITDPSPVSADEHPER
jgi:GntR family transcriptional repressor for pyruvate dehydrogenase complex